MFIEEKKFFLISLLPNIIRLLAYFLSQIMLKIVKMDFQKTFGECIESFNIKGKDLALKVGKTPGYVSEVRRGVCGLPLQNFGEWLDACESLAPGFKREFFRRISQDAPLPSHLRLEDVSSAIDSGKLNDDQVAVISSQVADIVVSISKRLKASVKNQTLSIR